MVCCNDDGRRVVLLVQTNTQAGTPFTIVMSASAVRESGEYRYGS